MIRRPPRSTLDRSSAASDVYKRQSLDNEIPITSIVFGETGKLMLKGMRSAMAAMVETGNNIIIDDIILETEFLNAYLRVFKDLKVYFVGVKCAIEVAEERESKRPGRFPGTALSQVSICHAHDLYDIEVDTAMNSPRECACLLYTSPSPRDRTRSRMPSSA